MMKVFGLLLANLVLIAMPTMLQAKIASQSEQHFVVSHKFESKKSVETVYKTFTNVSSWWEASHTFDGKAENLYFDFDQQRCFCEKVANGGFVQHLAAIHVQPMKKVVFSGGLGPLQDQAVSGKLLWTFEQTDNGVKVNVEYRVYGMIVDGMGKWPEAVDFVLGTQVKKLASLLK